MGTDINVHVEMLTKDGWLHYSRVRIQRDYQLFGELASVRSESSILKIKKPRGLPMDITKATKFDATFWALDAHSHSWISSKEYIQIYKIFINNKLHSSDEMKKFGDFFGNNYSGFYKYPDERPKGVLDFRFVFWFDC